ADVILANLRDAVPGSLLPVSRTGNGYTDLQFGYVAWALLALTIALLLRRAKHASWNRQTLCAATGAIVGAALFLPLPFPVPGLPHWVWAHLPIPVLQMTFAWPMQRLYLV